MASTSTNKQPLLVDRPLHEVYRLRDRTILTEEVTGQNFAQLLIDCTTNDGAILEDVYVLSRGPVLDEAGAETADPYQINLYLSTDNDLLRDTGVFVGSVLANATAGNWAHMTLPYILAPVPQVANANVDNKLRGFYIPRGKTLWAARQVGATGSLQDNPINAPYIGVHGGYF